MVNCKISKARKHDMVGKRNDVAVGLTCNYILKL